MSNQYKVPTEIRKNCRLTVVQNVPAMVQNHKNFSSYFFIHVFLFLKVIFSSKNRDRSKKGELLTFCKFTKSLELIRDIFFWDFSLDENDELNYKDLYLVNKKKKKHKIMML